MKRFIHHFFRRGEVSSEVWVVDRYLEWETQDGTKMKILDMDDSYLINMYHFIEMRRKNPSFRAFDDLMIQVLEELVYERGIDMSKNPSPVPYQNSDGEWMYEGLPATEEQILAYKLGIPLGLEINEESA